MKQIFLILLSTISLSLAAQTKQTVASKVPDTQIADYNVSAKFDTTLIDQLQVLKKINKDLTQEVKYRRDEEESMAKYIDELDDELGRCEDDLWYCRYQVDSILHAMGIQLNEIDSKLENQLPANRTAGLGVSYGSKFDNVIVGGQVYFNRVIFKGEYIFKSNDSFRLGLGLQVTNRLDIVGLVTFNANASTGFGTEVQYQIIPKVLGVVGTDTSRGVVFGLAYAF